MRTVRPEASTEPSRILRIPRACATPSCGSVFYVAHVADGADCPVCASARDRYDLSA